MTAFHTLYRPTNLGKIIGHETAVTRLQGMIAKGKIPNALMFLGPSSAGKTTLARAVAADINGLKTIQGSRDYIEHNAAEARTIDDLREILKNARFRAQAKKRIICIDEVQGLLSNNVAAQAILKPLEEPPPDTLFILCSMDPAKFTTGVGKAIANRCSQFVLEPHSATDLLKQAKRIAKAEDMKYVQDDEDKLLKQVVKNCSEMRTLANLMEGMQQYYEGMKDKPKRLGKDDIAMVLKSTESADDQLAVKVMLAIYQLKFKEVQRALLDVQDGFMFINKLLYANTYLLNTAVLDGARHRKVWGSKAGNDLMKLAKGVTLGTLAACQATLVETKAQAQSFAVSPEELLTSRLYRLVRELDGINKLKESK